MSAKPFNASSVVKSVFGKNNLEITFADEDQTIQVLNLNPVARQQLLVSLLARLPLRQGVVSDLIEPERILNILGIKRFVLPNGNPGLELLLGHKMSIGITFPPEGIKAFHRALATFDDKTTWDTSLPH